MLDGIITLVDAVHAQQQLDQFTIARAQIGYADRILLTKTDVEPDNEALLARLQRINAKAPVYKVINGDIDMNLLFNVGGFMLDDNVEISKPLFRFAPKQQNDIQSLVITMDKPVEISAISAPWKRCCSAMLIICCVTKGYSGLKMSRAACYSGAFSVFTVQILTANGVRMM